MRRGDSARYYDRAHPWMNAALIELRSGARFRIGRKRRSGHHHIGRSQSLAFGSFHIISGSLVEGRDDTTAERRDFSEGVHFTAVILRGNGLADSDRQISRHELPRGDAVWRAHIGIEL